VRLRVLGHLRRIPRQLLVKLAIRLGAILEEVSTGVADRTLPRFANTPKNVQILLPRRIIHPERIHLGDDVSLGPGCLLMAVTRYPSGRMRLPGGSAEGQRFSPRLVIGNRVSSTGGLQIAAHSEIIIEDDVLFATNVNITDCLHGYENALEPYKYQRLVRIAPIVIKRGSWIGQNVVVLPGVTIGEQCIVGANSVVTRDIPDRSIAVGAPARVIKRWDEVAQAWAPAAQQGESLHG
jgi:acetyltransferase-like isoleucine patch superfamily enzyme